MNKGEKSSKNSCSNVEVGEVKGIYFVFHASKKRFSWFPDWIPKVRRNVNLIDLVKSFSKEYLVAKFGRDTAETDSSKVCQKVT